MGVFDDKKFEQLDWMTQITETIESPLNQLLATLPDLLEINTHNIFHYLNSSSSMSLDKDNIVRSMQKNCLGSYKPSWEESKLLSSCFQFELSEDAEIDFDNNVMTGTILLRKVVFTFEDDKLQSFMGSQGCEQLNRMSFGDNCLPRINEILELLGNCAEHLKGRSGRRKKAALTNRLRHIMKTNEWRIRDAELADKIGMWAYDYIRNGNLAALTNFCKVKVMTHSNMPIYSIEEEK